MAFVVITLMQGNPVVIKGSPSLWTADAWEVFDKAVARGGCPELHSWINGKEVISPLFPI